jgi:hypothetical protein
MGCVELIVWRYFWLHIPVTVTLIASGGCLGLVFLIWMYFWLSHRGARYVYFDAQDFAKYEGGGGRKLPVSAATGTFEPLLKHYIDVTKLLVTIAAASITFGGTHDVRTGIFAAKLILAFSILYGVLFCAAVLYMYDEYGQNVEVYTRFWYSSVESLGFATLLTFFIGYLVWALNLG